MAGDGTTAALVGKKQRIAHTPKLLLSPSGSSAAAALAPPAAAHPHAITSRSSSASGVKGTVGAAAAAAAATALLVKRPVVPLDYTTPASSKVPLIVRQQLMNKLIDEFLKGIPGSAAGMSGEEAAEAQQRAIDSGLQEEKGVADRAKSKQMYSMIGANTLLRVRNQIASAAAGGSSTTTSSSSSSNSKRTLSRTTPEGNVILDHEAMLIGSASNFSIVKRTRVLVSDIPDHLLHRVLQAFLMTADQLRQHGFPIVDPSDPSKVLIPQEEEGSLSRPPVPSDFSSRKRTCCRCRKEFAVDRKGVPLDRTDVCIHHPGRIWSQRQQGSLVRIFSCCGVESTETASGSGCASADAHVVDGTTHPDYMEGFVKTKRRKEQQQQQQQQQEQESCPGIYALDCEMCNTTIGMELTRVTVVDTRCRTVYESLVRPDHPILDYNSKFSGIHPGDLDGVST